MVGDSLISGCPLGVEQRLLGKWGTVSGCWSDFCKSGMSKLDETAGVGQERGLDGAHDFGETDRAVAVGRQRQRINDATTKWMDGLAPIRLVGWNSYKAKEL